MKKMMRWMLLVPMVFSMASCVDVSDNPVTSPVTDDKPFTYDSEIDATVRPGDNFYQYAVGQWLNSSNPAPSMWKQIGGELTAALTQSLATAGDPLLVTLRSQADEALTDDSRSVALLKERIAMLAQVTTADELYAAFSALYRLGYSPVFRLRPFVSQGRQVVALMGSGGMSPEVERFMAVKHADGISTMVSRYCQMLKNLGFDDERILEVTDHALYVEMKEMDAYSTDIEMIRKPLKARKYRRAGEEGDDDDDEEMEMVASLMQMMGLDIDDVLSGRVLPYGEAVSELMNAFMQAGDDPEMVAVFRDYLIYNVMSQDALLVPSVSGIQSKDDILLTAVQYHRYYKYRLVVEHFGRENIYKQQCADIMEQMRARFMERIGELDWMSDATKAEAQQKAAAVNFYIGYPDEWNEQMTPRADGDCLLETVTQLRQQSVTIAETLAGQDIDNAGWDIWAIYGQATTDNAFYVPTANSLVILPSWLMRPRFNSELNEATLYATATTFAHELCHGFDSMGSQYDAEGYERDWWAPADMAAFMEKQQAMIGLFNQLEAYPGQPADGEKTLAENMADYGGMVLTLDCYLHHLAQQGFAKEQVDEQLKKFFLSFAQVWKIENELQESSLIYQYETDEHSAAHNRVNGMMRLLDDWYRLYDVQPADRLYLAPADRVKIW